MSKDQQIETAPPQKDDQWNFKIGK